MKKILVIGFFCMCITAPASAATGAHGFSAFSPEVQYLRPLDNAAVTGNEKGVIEFKWRLTPMPPARRRYFEITIFEGFTNEIIVKKILGQRVSSFEIDAGTFVAGRLYTWRLRQRGHNGVWSLGRRWKFTVTD